jgi:hypothetical protein
LNALHCELAPHKLQQSVGEPTFVNVVRSETPIGSLKAIKTLHIRGIVVETVVGVVVVTEIRVVVVVKLVAEEENEGFKPK